MTRAETLDAAKACVCQNREQEYGSPEDNFRIIAEMWEVYIKAKCLGLGENRYGRPQFDLTILPEDIAVMMAMLKIARIATGTFKEDSFVDACGYIACAAELAKGE